MKANPIPLIATLLLFSFSASCQQDPAYSLLLKSGSFTPSKNISPAFTSQFNSRTSRIEGQSFTIIQFDHIPSTAERELLSNSGIELLDYIPNNAYTVSIKTALNENLLNLVKARAIVELAPEQKMLPLLARGIIPLWAIKIPGTLDVWISFPKTLSLASVTKELQQRNFDIISTLYKDYHVIGLRISVLKLNELASLPFIDYVQPAPPEDKPLGVNNWTNWGRDGVKASLLNADASVGGRNLRGEGVVIGVGDDSDPHLHVDFTNRIINRAATNYTLHGTHVTGIVGGAGIQNEVRTGFAPKSTIISQYFGGIINNATSYVNDHGMVITNNSYGNIVDDCDFFGIYDIYSRILDQQAIDLPNLQTVFAAGNSGLMSCTPYPDSFKTVLGSYQSAKNVITVGNATPLGSLFIQSSKGPVKDGRIKPEIISIGSFIMSTSNPFFGFYWENTGTSMAAPAVAGGLGLLYQRYRQLNSGANPKNGLMKTLVCNSGTDWGNAGPDYKHGFGLVNFWRALNMLENNHYASSSIALAGTDNYSITVPAGLAQLKVMLYWNDPPASLLPLHTLVNDLDLEVINPSSTTVLPFILDTIPANIKNAAVNGADHINNIEQVVINNPAAGNYTIRVKGTGITQNPTQEYFVAYDYVPTETKLVAPIGGEGYIPGEQLMVQWDSYGDPANPFTIQFSFDNGATWIDSTQTADKRFLGWVVPSIASDQVLVGVTRNGTAFTSTSFPFTIIAQPIVTLSAVQCEGYISIDWTAVAGATDYEVMMLRGDEMVSVTTTNATSYTFNGLSKDSVYWVTVRPRINGHPGRRSLAISRQPNSGTCAGTISDNDLKMDAIVSPTSGRQFTSTALTAATTITVRMKNLDDVAVNNFDLKYFVNGILIATEPVSTPVGGGAVYTHNFTTTYDFSTTGIYTIKAVINNTSAVDPVSANDTVTMIVKQLANPPLTISVGSDFLDDLETATTATYYNRQVGLSGLDRYDFIASTAYGRLRPFINTGIAYSGSKALTLDMDRFDAGGNIDSLTGTFNLSGYTAASDDIRLDFRYKNHGQLSNAANKVWVRGNDQQPWILVYDLFANQNDPGNFKKSSSIELSDLLAAGSQDFSGSFQVRWGQWGKILAADNDLGAGYTFDDIHVYKVIDDIQMISIDTPTVNSCGLNATTPIKVTVRNSVNTTVSNIPVKFRIDGGSITTENISSIAGNTSIQYTFTATANLAAIGTHTVQAWVDYPTDSYRDNDTATLTIINSPVISSFPYLENFESGNGSWYSGGKLNSWEYGTPASTKIKSAASGSKAWKTRMAGNYNDLEFSYLYSPCFDLTGMTTPTLSLSIALDIEDCGGSLCDGAWVEYSADGIAWTKLGAFGSGTNWYNKNYGAGANPLWSVQNYTRWHVATTALPTGINRLHLRFVINSDEGVNREGIAIDDIHIYDNINGIYNGATMGAPVTQNIAGGTSWIDFTSGGKLVASIQPNNQNMGNTDVQAFINTAAVRYTATQYYHNRNITIIPANYSLVDSTSVRFYFLDSETEALLNATGCSGCSKPRSAYELGVSKYTDPALRTNEDGSILNDIQGTWSFINSSKAVKVPFDKGYYAEFKVKDFSEFWLNNGGFTGSATLPVKFISFTARKQSNNNDVLVDWKTVEESNINRYEIEVARNSRDYQTNNFVKIGEVASRGNSSSQQDYNFTDLENYKSGVRYYRLKIIENSGSFSYSVIRSVIFTNELTWQVFPNPSTGNFNFVFQQTDGEVMNVKVYDMNGKLVKQAQAIADGFVQKVNIDLRPSKFATGLYMIVAEGNRKAVFKVLKQ